MIVEQLNYDDVIWYAEVASVRMLEEEVKMPEAVNLEQIYKLCFMGIEQGTAFICKDKGVPVGALGGLIAPNPYNPNLQFLIEMFWYVLPEYRKGRAGLMLLNKFIERSDELNLPATLSLLSTSNINISTLERKGFVLCEKSFRRM